MFKRSWLVLILLTSLFSLSFADENNYAKAAMLIEDNLMGNSYNILQISGNLSNNEKLMLYNRYKKNDAALPLIVNLFLGLGIGSYIQGDSQGGTVGLVGELGGVGLILFGYSTYSPIMLTTGSILLLGTRIYELIRPFTFQSNYNKVLRDSLGLTGMAFFMLPGESFETWNAGFVATIKL